MARKPAARSLPWLLALCANGACVRQNAGVDPPAAADDGGTGADADDDAIHDARPPHEVRPPSPSDGPPPFLAGDPAVIGCSDGTREAFLDVSSGGWPNIAGCAGAWTAPGIVGAAGQTPKCERNSGDSSPNTSGLGCGPADLCAVGWHVCATPGEVDGHSLSDCEAGIPSGQVAFFAIGGAAASVGVCATDPMLTNDLHGCGSFGQPESEGCYPLDRRLGFADCRDTGGIWRCGDADHHLEEAALVIKTSTRMGGVLCCRMP